MSRGEMLQVQMNIIETKQIYKPWLPLLKANLPRSTRTKGGKRDSSPRWQMSLMTWKNCDIVVVLIYGVDTKVYEKLTLLTKVYKAVCQSMGEENINKLVRRYNHTLLCHCHTMTADKISLLYFVAMNCELWHLHRSRWRATWARWSSSHMSWSASRMLLRSGSVFFTLPFPT